jgi:protein transport protein SEC20
MSLQDLQNQLSKLADINKQTFNLITRLGKLPFQPGSVPLQASSSNPDVRVELSQEIHQSLKQQTESLELLQQEIDDFNPGGRGSEREREKARLHAYGARLGEDLKL